MAEMAAPAPSAQAARDGAAGQETRRYIALNHRLQLQAPADTLLRHFAAIQAECTKLGCIIIEANQLNPTGHRPPEASLSARLPPAEFDKFLKSALSGATLLAHTRTSEDKTAEVIDVEARIKNLQALRARVLELLEKRTGNLKETLEAERQLAETQAQLDSIQGRRAALARETDMVKVDLQLVAESLAAEGSWAAPVADAFKESGRVLMSSLGALITVVVAALPWVLLLTVLFLLARRAWRKRRARIAGR